MTNQLVFHNGEYVSKQEVLISPFQSGLYYGDGCFETLRAYKGKFLHLSEHLDRLNRAASYLGMAQPEIEEENIRKLIELNGLTDQDAIIRIQAWREGKRGFRQNSDDKVNIIAESTKFKPETRPFKLIASSIKVMPKESLSRNFKLSNALNYLLAGQEAHESEADAALMLTIEDFVSETEVANIFWIKDDQLYTPSNECDHIPGITRFIICELFPKVHFGKFKLDELLNADSIFLTNSVREVVSVISVDDVDFDINNPFLSDIRSALEDYKLSHLE